MIASEILSMLKEPFPEKAIHWRVGATTGDKSKGIALAYINARDVMKRLDEVCGLAGWACVYRECAGIAVCELSLLVDGDWVTKSDGAGTTDYEGEKGMLSDALKRAAVRFGIGRYLYYLPNSWVPIEKSGKSYKISSPPKLPDWAKPTVHRFKPGEKDKIYSAVRNGLDAGDEVAVIEVFNEYKGPDEQMKLWTLFNSKERSAIKALTGH